ncbi:MAG: hypothetical protein H7Z40_10650 [Phycisphaerae bacterium]|nr:hypothetical protein [Gemmatimonadaceae bacterium]
MKRARGAVGMGLIWAAVWAPVAVVIGTGIIDPDNSMDEMWVMVGAIPGFLSGVLFSVVLSRVGRRQRLAELSIKRAFEWGGAAGLGIGVLPFVLGDTGGRPWFTLAATVITSITALSAASAAGSLALAQRAERRELGAGGANLDEVILSSGKEQELLGKK